MCYRSGRASVFTDSSSRKNQQESEVTGLLCKVVRAVRAIVHNPCFRSENEN